MRKGYRENGTAIAAAILAACFLTGCSDGASDLKSFVSRQAHSVLDQKDEIPLPEVVSEGKSIPVTQSTYCWGTLGCADYVGGIMMVRDKVPAPVKPGAAIRVAVPYKPAPSQVDVVQYLEGNDFVAIPLTGGSFRTPLDPGVYYYGISAFWTTADGKYSKGDTSVVFSVEVK